MAIDISRLTEGVMLSPEVSRTILAETLEQSAIQKLATRINIPGSGLAWQTITGEPQAGWVSETNEKPVSRPTFGTEELRPYKMAVIIPFSDEFRRDASGLFAEVQRRVPAALGRLFDRTVLGLVDAPGDTFDQLDGATEVPFGSSNAGDAYDSLLDVDMVVSDNGGVLNGWALAPSTRNRLMRIHTNGQPAFASGVSSGDVLSTLLGAQVAYSKAFADVDGLMGIGGDWSAAQWGTVEGIKLDISTESTLTETVEGAGTRTLNLWQRNMFALRAEAEVAFKADESKFARLTAQ